MRQRRYYFWILLGLAALCGRIARADAYDPTTGPTGYYSTATGTSATLKGQLYTITSTGFVSREYGDARYAFELIDKDPTVANNILLIYNRASVDGTWDNGATFNREHVWPKSLLGLTSDQVNNSYNGVASDLFELRPSNPVINSSRGNNPYGYNTTTVPHAHGNVSDPNTPSTGTYWYPGDSDRGDVARTIFYLATRYGQGQTHNLSLVNDQPDVYEMGDLASYIKWHYEDVPDTFERRRNHLIHSSADNPLYYQGNRNPYIDHPEWVWSVYVDQNNNSKITIANPTTVNTSTGSSTKSVNLGRILINAAVPAAQSFTLNKDGANGTYYEISTDTNGYSSNVARFNAFKTGGLDSRSIDIGLKTTTSTATPGTLAGTVTVDNLDITSGGCSGAGCGANDQNDVFNVSLTVLNHAIPSFASASTTTSTTLDFGNIALGDSPSPLAFSVFDRNAPSGPTAALDLDSISGSNPKFSTSLSLFSNLAAGSSQLFSAMFNATSIGTFQQIYTLTLSDENLPGAQNNMTLSLTLKGAVRLAGDYNGDLKVDAADYVVWRKRMGQTVTAYSSADGDGNGTINALDFNVWRAHFGQTASGSGTGLLADAVPEPTACWLIASGVLIGALRRRGRNYFAPGACK